MEEQYSEDGKTLIEVKDAEEDFIVPEDVILIGDRAFCDCTVLQYIDIPDGVAKIGEGAFKGCTSLQSIHIPNSVTEIGNEVFRGCTSLQSIDIPVRLTEIGGEAFRGCTSLQSIHLRLTDPNELKIGIEDSSFEINDNMILYIPSGTRWKYRHHPVFGKFKNIEIEPRHKD